MGTGSIWCQATFNQPRPASIRYAIDRDSDLDQIFDIDADTGAIVTGKGLDRETAGWHNITVLAMEAGKLEGRGSMERRVKAEAGQSGRTLQRWQGGRKAKVSWQAPPLWLSC